MTKRYASCWKKTELGLATIARNPYLRLSSLSTVVVDGGIQPMVNNIIKTTRINASDAVELFLLDSSSASLSGSLRLSLPFVRLPPLRNLERSMITPTV